MSAALHAQRQLTRLVGLTSALLMLGAAKCPSKKAVVKPAVAKASAIPDSANQVLFGQRSVLTDKGVAKGLLLSDTAFTYDDGARLELRRVHFTFYTSLGTQDGVMTARSAVYNSRLSRLEATGDVVVTRNDSTRLTSQQLVYDQARNQIFSDSAFILNKPEKQFSGVGFESDPQMSHWKCLRACKGIAPVQIPAK